MMDLRLLGAGKIGGTLGRKWCAIWFALVFGQGKDRNLAFKLLTR